MLFVRRCQISANKHIANLERRQTLGEIEERNSLWSENCIQAAQG